MTVANWVLWNRTELDIQEREKLLDALTPEQKRQLLQNDYVWADRLGIIWQPPDGQLRRARFTHDARFETRRGAFRVDSEGTVHAAGASD